MPFVPAQIFWRGHFILPKIVFCVVKNWRARRARVYFILFLKAI